MDDPAVTVVIATYDRASFLARAIRSVRAQSGVQAAIIVVDDASNDDTTAVLRSLAGPDLRVLRNDRNRERSYSRNRGVAAADSEFVAFLDSDDEYLPGHLRRSLRALRAAPDAVLSYGRTDVHDEATGVTIFSGPTEPIGEPALPTLLAENRFMLSSVVARRGAVLDAGGFCEDPEVLTAEDWHLWMKLAAEGPFVFAGPEPAARMHWHEANSVWEVDRHVAAVRTAHQRGLQLGDLSQEQERRARAGLEVVVARAHLDAGTPRPALRGLLAALRGEPEIARDVRTWRTVARALLQIGTRRS